MINTCFEPFGAGKPDKPQSEALQRYLQKGGGLFGTHCAAVTFQSAQPPALYNQLIGARGKGANTEQPSTCTKVADHPSTAMLPATFPYQGNLDNHDYVAPDSTVLVKCKWSTGMEVPTSFARTEGAGRVFYANFAKEDVDLKDATVGAKHVIPGFAWVLHL
jgi:type 1 glutamine amidotransferase